MSKDEGYIYLGNNINSVIIDKVLYIKEGYTPNIDSSFDYNVSMISNNNKIDMLNKMINENMINLTSFEENKITGKITGNDGIIYTSIPYDDGWNVYVDGKKTDTLMIGNSLLGFDISDGEHEITLEYKIPYFKTGMVISIGALFLIIGYSILKKFDYIV